MAGTNYAHVLLECRPDGFYFRDGKLAVKSEELRTPWGLTLVACALRIAAGQLKPCTPSGWETCGGR